MAPPAIEMKTGDTAPFVRHTLVDAAGQPVDLSGAAVQFIVATMVVATRTILVNAAGTVTQVGDGSRGEVLYQWAAGDTDVAGEHIYEWEVTYANGEIQTFPTEGYGPCTFAEDLGNAAP